MKKFKNQVHLEGFLYEHNLEKRVTGAQSKKPGTEYISGTIDIVTDNDQVNVVTVRFPYTTEGQSNYSVLNSIMNGEFHSIMQHGKDNADCIRIDTSIVVNEWYDKSTGNFVANKRCEGGFIYRDANLNPRENARNYFTIDTIITSAQTVEGDAEAGTKDKIILKGWTVNYKKELFPVEFPCEIPEGIAYFESLAPSSSEPAVIGLRGGVVSQTIKSTIEEESAFGDPYIREVVRKRRDFMVTTSTPLMDWDDESTITAQEVSEGLAAREVRLAAEKQRVLDKDNKPSAAAASVPAGTGFTF